MNKLIEQVWNWALSKNIDTASTPTKQMTKTLEECAEVIREIEDWQTYHDPDFLMNAKEEYGDVLVTLIIGMKMLNLEPEECLQVAYDKISKRTGRIEGGVFVKDK